MPKYSISQIKASNKPKEEWQKQFPLIHYIIRPASFYLTYFIIQITETPTHIVWTGLLIGLLGCFSFLFIEYFTIWAGIILLTIYVIFDSVDGNIARVARKVTYYGKFLDSIVGEVVEGSYCFWFGLGLYLNPLYLSEVSLLDLGSKAKLIMLLTGVLIAFARLYGNLFQGSYYENLAAKQDQASAAERSITDDVKTSCYSGRWWHLVFINLNLTGVQLVLMVLFLVFKAIDLFLLFFLFYYLLRMLVMFLFYLNRARLNLSSLN